MRLWVRVRVNPAPSRACPANGRKGGCVRGGGGTHRTLIELLNIHQQATGLTLVLLTVGRALQKEGRGFALIQGE